MVSFFLSRFSITLSPEGREKAATDEGRRTSDERTISRQLPHRPETDNGQRTNGLRAVTRTDNLRTTVNRPPPTRPPPEAANCGKAFSKYICHLTFAIYHLTATNNVLYCYSSAYLLSLSLVSLSFFPLPTPIPPPPPSIGIGVAVAIITAITIATIVNLRRLRRRREEELPTLGSSAMTMSSLVGTSYRQPWFW